MFSFLLHFPFFPFEGKDDFVVNFITENAAYSCSEVVSRRDSARNSRRRRLNKLCLSRGINWQHVVKATRTLRASLALSAALVNQSSLLLRLGREIFRDFFHITKL